MGKDPAVLFYTSDFLTGTSFFSYEERGQYITLLCQQHQAGSIPENHMISVCKSLDSVVAKKFTRDTDGTYYQWRMREETERRSNYCKSRSNNKSGRPPKEIIRKSYDYHMETETETEDVNKKTKGKRFVPPTVEEVRAYCQERKNTVDPEKFVDTYASNGWKVGKNKTPMKDWRAAIRSRWEKNDMQSTSSKLPKRL